MASNVVPLTVNSPLATNYLSAVAIGSQRIMPSPSTTAGYWILVVDRTTLKVVFNQVQASYDSAPDLGSYDSDDYFMIVAAIGVTLDKVPQGDFYTFLTGNGAGPQLSRLEQINDQIGCGAISNFGYVLISVLGLGGSVTGIEASSIDYGDLTGVIVTASLLGTVVDGQTVYSPVILQ